MSDHNRTEPESESESEPDQVEDEDDEDEAKGKWFNKSKNGRKMGGWDFEGSMLVGRVSKEESCSRRGEEGEGAGAGGGQKRLTIQNLEIDFIHGLAWRWYIARARGQQRHTAENCYMH
jgi:hypothetical protein